MLIDLLSGLLFVVLGKLRERVGLILLCDFYDVPAWMLRYLRLAFGGNFGGKVFDLLSVVVCS